MSGVEGWVTHNGGPNPVPGARVEWRNREGSNACCKADELSGWEHPYGPDGIWDIIAYRVVTSAALSAIEGGGGALQPSASVPTEPVADRWADLERLAKAATQHVTGDWHHDKPETWIWAGDPRGGRVHIADIRGWGYLTGRGGGLGLDETPAFDQQKAWGRFIAAANPAAILELIAAARTATQ
jgi:hypothetical protein